MTLRLECATSSMITRQTSNKTGSIGTESRILEVLRSAPLALEGVICSLYGMLGEDSHTGMAFLSVYKTSNSWATHSRTEVPNRLQSARHGSSFALHNGSTIGTCCSFISYRGKRATRYWSQQMLVCHSSYRRIGVSIIAFTHSAQHIKVKVDQVGSRRHPFT